MKSKLNHLLDIIRPGRHGLYLALAALVFMGVVAGLAELIDELRESDLILLDVSILQYINRTATPFWDRFFLSITHLGDVIFLAPVTILLTAEMIRRRRTYRAVFVVLNIVGAIGITLAAKLAIGRHRPELWETLVIEPTYSFPSGHTVGSTALAISLLAVSWNTRWRWPVVILAVPYALLVGYSRMYLGVHYPTDIIGGWFVSVAWAVIVAGLLSTYAWRQRLRQTAHDQDLIRDQDQNSPKA